MLALMNKKLKIAVSIFANAFAFGLQITGIMPVLNLIAEKYSGYSTGTIQLLQTIPYALLIVGSLSVFTLHTNSVMLLCSHFGQFTYLLITSDIFSPPPFRMRERLPHQTFQDFLIFSINLRNAFICVGFLKRTPRIRAITLRFSCDVLL